MPYISKTEKKLLLSRQIDLTQPGQLNYCVSVLMDDYIEKTGLNYKTLNDLVGALECAKMELYRRIAIPYENKKIEDNGDVYINSMLQLKEILRKK